MAETQGDAISRLVAECGEYWIRTHVPRRAVREMQAELETHLREAAAAGKPPQTVVGPDLAAFAEEWAAEQRRGFRRTALARPRIGRPPGRRDYLVGMAIVVLIGAALALGPREETVEDIEVWRWVWIVAAVVLGIAEMFTAGFFMLPFAVGAVAAALLAFFNVVVPIQLLVFIAVSIAALIGLQRYVRHEDETQPEVGSNRYLNKRAVVLEPVNRVQSVGRVRMDTEEWRATTDLTDTIPVGTEVRIVDVRGARLVVEPIDAD